MVLNVTANECIKTKNWKELAKLQAEEIKQKHYEELKKKDDEFFSYVVAKAKKQKKIRMGG